MMQQRDAMQATVELLQQERDEARAAAAVAVKDEFETSNVQMVSQEVYEAVVQERDALEEMQRQHKLELAAFASRQETQSLLQQVSQRHELEERESLAMLQKAELAGMVSKEKHAELIKDRDALRVAGEHERKQIKELKQERESLAMLHTAELAGMVTKEKHAELIKDRDALRVTGEHERKRSEELKQREKHHLRKA